MFSRFSLIAVIAIIIVIAGCQPAQRSAKNSNSNKKDTGISSTEPKKSLLNAKFKHAGITWDDEKGNRLWEAAFKEAVASQTGDDAVIELSGVKAKLYRDGKAVSNLVAPKVIADSRTKEIKASGGVTLTSASQGASARSGSLTWRSKTGKVLGTGGVKMIRGNISIEANSFESDTALKKAKFSAAELSMN